jgi:hypothetical protein
VEPFYLVASRHRGLKQQGADHIIDGAKSALDFTVIRKGVWGGHPQDDPTGGKECTGAGIVKLSTVVTLDDFDGEAKLFGDKGEKIDNVGKVSDFTHRGKVPTK